MALGAGTALAEVDDRCGENAQAVALAQLIVQAEGQQRAHMHCNASLARIAAAKAQTLARHGRVDHNIEHTTPNQFVQANGYGLPSAYPVLGNQLESLAAGKPTAQGAFSYYLTSPHHKAHLLGENSFYQGQTQIGVGYHYSAKTPHQDYWVVLIAHAEEDALSVGRMLFSVSADDRQALSNSLQRERVKRLESRLVTPSHSLIRRRDPD